MTIKNKCFISENNEYFCFGNIYNLFVHFKSIAHFREKWPIQSIATEPFTRNLRKLESKNNILSHPVIVHRIPF